MLRIHNTLTGTVDKFVPKKENEVTIYTCGLTVYSEPHIGNWVAYIRWDLLVRTLRASGLNVRRVMNITDVGHLVSDGDEGEDKMQKGARREGITEWEVAERYTKSFLDGMSVLNLQPPEYMTKATEHIDIQIELIKKLESKGYTYVIDDGVYFDTARFPDYASFAHLNLTSQRAGARVAFNDSKRNGSDFVLWRLTPKGESRTMEWDSPWGRGIPGWHIECSAMAIKYLGETLDIHTGGIDHISVHHTNEIAQSEAATGKRFANYWMHANFLLVNGTKISKSLDNGYTLADLEQKGFSAMDFKLFVIQSNYRTESSFTWETIAAAATRLTRWKSIAAIRHQVNDTTVSDDEIDADIHSVLLSVKHAVLEALEDDMNSPLALTHIEKAFSRIEVASLAHIKKSALTELIQFLDDILGLQLMDSTPDISDTLEQLLLERQRARESKDWDRSDELRAELLKNGIAINDTNDGVRWSYA